MRRRPFWQRGAAKWRMIDNGRTSGHNEAAFMSETISTSSFDAPVQLLRRLRSIHGRLADRFAPKMGSEDMEDAYRRIPVATVHRRFNVIALRPPQSEGCGLHFVPCHCMPFGLKSAVVNFNRTAELAVGALRRLCAILAWHCFDDTGFLQLAIEDDWEQLAAASMLNDLFD
eukprot:5660863-Amphidinium_carterae.1